MIDVLIDYAVLGLGDTVKAELVDADVWELREHAGFSSLAPGDRIRVDEQSRIAEIVSLERTFVHVVHFHLPAGITAGHRPSHNHPAMIALREVEEEWRRDTWVTRLTGFTFAISSPSQGWFVDKVATHEFVEEIEQVRTPDTQLDLTEILAHPRFGATEL